MSRFSSLGCALLCGALVSAVGCFSSGNNDDDDDGVQSGGSGGTSTSSGAGGTGSGSGGTGSQLTGYLEPCNSDKDCRQYTLLCDTSLGCVQCLQASHCPAPADGEATCSAGLCGAIVPCETSLDCPVDQVCDGDAGVCVGCLTDNDCADGESCSGNRCIASASCETSLDCPIDQVCDSSDNTCVECVSTADCESGECIANACVTPTACTETAECSGDLVCDTDEGICVECVIDDDCSGDDTCEDHACKPPVVVDCDTPPKVMILLQRSGSMFELPALEDPWWTAIQAALTDGSESVVSKYGAEMELSLRIFYRETDNAGAACPLEEEVLDTDAAGIDTLMNAQAEAHDDTAFKIDAPLPEAITEAASALGSSGRRVIVLLTTGLPDSCMFQDTLCRQDAVVAATQAAHADGVELYVVGFGENMNVLWDATVPTYYSGFLAALANAGAGETPQGPPYTGCTEDSSPAATYAETGGDAPYYNPMATSDVAGALDDVFTAIGACE